MQHHSGRPWLAGSQVVGCGGYLQRGRKVYKNGGGDCLGDGTSPYLGGILSSKIFWKMDALEMQSGTF